MFNGLFFERLLHAYSMSDDFADQSYIVDFDDFDAQVVQLLNALDAPESVSVSQGPYLHDFLENLVRAGSELHQSGLLGVARLFPDDEARTTYLLLLAGLILEDLLPVSNHDPVFMEKVAAVSVQLLSTTSLDSGSSYLPRALHSTLMTRLQPGVARWLSAMLPSAPVGAWQEAGNAAASAARRGSVPFSDVVRLLSRPQAAQLFSDLNGQIDAPESALVDLALVTSDS